jgi:Amidohydrolase family
MLNLALLALISAPGLAPVQGVEASPRPSLLAIRARTIQLGGGDVIQDGVILVENGKIRAVGKGIDVPAGAGVLEHDGVVTAGLVALHGYAGTRGPRGPSGPVFVFGQAQLLGPESGAGAARAQEADDARGTGEDWQVHVHGHEEIDEVVIDEIHDKGELPAPAAEKPAAEGGASELEGLFAARDASVDTTRTVFPEADLSYAFDPESSDLKSALQAGITSLVLTPDAQSLVPGRTAVVKTSGRMLKRGAHLSIGFRADALESNRYPTSYSGALAELEQRFDAKQGAFSDAQAGREPVLFEVADRQDVQRAVDFAKEHKLTGALAGADRVGELAAAVRDAGLAVVVGPFQLGADARYLRSVVQLAKAGVPFGFGLDDPLQSPATLRFNAAACVRAGLDRQTALDALTDTAARIAGVGDRVGRIAPGMDADLVLWSGDPLDLGSRVETVLVDGETVAGGGR